MNFKSILMTRPLVVAAVVSGSLLAAACGGTSTSGGGSASSSSAPVSGTVTASGSTALQPLVAAAKDQFETDNPQATIQVTGGGSGTGLSQVASGAVSIGDSDIPVSQSSITDPSSLVDHQVAVVAFAIIVNKSVSVSNLTKQQAHDVITGRVTNWKDVGGNDQKIAVILRPATSGTRKVFKKIVLGADTETSNPASTQDATNTVLQLVGQTPGAVSYVAIGSVKPTDNVSKLKFEGVEPSVATVESGKYAIWSHEHMYTKGQPTGAVKAFLDFVLSSKFQGGSAFSALGFVPTAKVPGQSPADQ